MHTPDVRVVQDLKHKVSNMKMKAQQISWTTFRTGCSVGGNYSDISMLMRVVVSRNVSATSERTFQVHLTEQDKT